MKPHEQVAAEFMRHKGYGGLAPYDVRKLPARARRTENAWRFYYELPGGHELELDVWWNDAAWWTDNKAPGWDVAVHDFYDPAQVGA